MKTTPSTFHTARVALSVCAFGFLLGASPVHAQAQNAAASVIASAGENFVARGGTRVALRRGDNVQVGDVVEVGAASNVQLRFTDEAIVALRENTRFGVNDFSFNTAKPEESRSAFSLLAGGLRTITGRIGQVARSNYRVTTPTATIGIRGTHFNLVSCTSNCANADGTRAPEGTYGGVSDGQISVTNSAGTSVFGKDQFFLVASANSPAQGLIAPPPFLHDRQAGQRRTASPSTPAPAGTAATATTDTLAGSGVNSDSRAAGSAGGSAVSAAALVVETPLTVQQTNTLNSAGLPSTIQATNSGTVFYRAVNQTVPVLNQTGTSPAINATGSTVSVGINFAAQRAFFSANLFVDGNTSDAIDIGTPLDSGGIPLTSSGGKITFTRTFNRADFPNQTGAFRCSQCGPGNTVGFLDRFTVTGEVSGSTVTTRIDLADQGGSGTVNYTLTSAPVPNNKVAASTISRQTGGTDTAGSSYWGVDVDSTGRLTRIGGTTGRLRASVGTAVNTIRGSNASAGNLVWGEWTGPGAQVTDGLYNTYTSNNANFFSGWITGDVTNTIPTNLGTSVTYSPVGAFVRGGTGQFVTSVGGNLSVNFASQVVTINSLTAARTSGEVYTMNGSSGYSTVSGRFAAGFSSVTCAGGSGCTGTQSGSFQGFFSGTNAEGIGMAFTAGNGSVGISGVAGFKR